MSMASRASKLLRAVAETTSTNSMPPLPNVKTGRGERPRSALGRTISPMLVANSTGPVEVCMRGQGAAFERLWLLCPRPSLRRGWALPSADVMALSASNDDNDRSNDGNSNC